MKSIEFVSLVHGGKLVPHVRNAIMVALSGMEGKLVRITISESKRRRSNKQNDFYWGYVIPIVKAMFIEQGNDIDNDGVHEYLKMHVSGLKEVIKDPSGVRKSIVLQSRKLNTHDWEDYITKIRVWAAEFGVQIPFPNEDLEVTQTMRAS